MNTLTDLVEAQTSDALDERSAHARLVELGRRARRNLVEVLQAGDAR